MRADEREGSSSAIVDSLLTAAVLTQTSLPMSQPAAAAAVADASTAGSASASVLPQLPPLRLLLLDNFDSFTHNLVHACAALARTRPLVRFNTLSRAELAELLREQNIDCVLVSPGPGSPANQEDFGCCADIYNDPQFKYVPVLGSVYTHRTQLTTQRRRDGQSAMRVDARCVDPSFSLPSLRASSRASSLLLPFL